MFTKSEHMSTQLVGLSSPVSTVYARNAWDHNPPFGGSYYITGDEWGKKKRSKYEWSAGKQL